MNLKTPREQKIYSLLQGTLEPTVCQLLDESAMHAGHEGAKGGGGHYKLIVVSSRFTGLNRVQRHRLVYDCLRDMMATEIHALAINALAPSEASSLDSAAGSSAA